MYSKENLLDMIDSSNPSTRYDACEWLRISQESSPEMVYALQKATVDENTEVAARAQLALQADAHHKMAIKMGLIQRLENEPDEAEQQKLDQAQAVNDVIKTHASMLKAIRSNGFWLIGLGVLHIILSGWLSAPWGVLLIIVGLCSFLFHSPSMFVIYAITLIWASISNFIGFSPIWAFFAFFQLYFSVRIFMDFRKYRKVENEYSTVVANKEVISSATERTPRLFPWLGTAFGCSSLLGFVMIILVEIIVILATKTLDNIPTYLIFLERLLVNMGVLGFAMGLASLLSKYRPKALGIVGLVAGVLTLIINFGLRFL
jgi:hypothetical protein